MLNFNDISLHRGEKQLFEHLTLTIFAGQKVGVTGANGCGKSSLFALIRGQLSADQGEFLMPDNLVIAHVAQEIPAGCQSALDYVLDGDRELREIEQALAVAQEAHQGERLAESYARLESIDGYTAPARAGRLLHGLGFTNGQESLPVEHFSGGWRMRLNLAQALMCRSDLLLLDEPTNHLDLDAVLWLEEWLRRYPGTLLLISHDRDFLDGLCDHIVHFEQQKGTLYRGNYSAFEVLRAQALANQQANYEKQQREIAHIRHYVDRFRAQATKARQAQSRLKSLEHMTLIAPAHVDSPFHFQFRAPVKLPTQLLKLEQVNVGYAETPILKNINLQILPGDRIGLLGANGAGKSTLIKTLAGSQAQQSGELQKARDLHIGYFAQHQLEQLDNNASPLLHLQRIDKQTSEQELRDYLGGFAFHGDQALQSIKNFSGGEKARLSLALLIYQRPNLLLLDEPTNHLDLEMRHALTLALQDYQGALIIVSHDRHLLRSVTDQWLLVDDGRVQEFDGDLEQYRQWLLDRDKSTNAEKPASEEAQHSAAARKQKRQEEADKRKQSQPLRQQLQKVEKELARVQTQLSELEQQLAQPEIYETANKDKLKKLLLEKSNHDKRAQELEEEWLTVSEQLEQFE